MLDYSFSFADLEFFLLVFVRVSAFIFTAPFFSTANTPRRVRAGLSIFIAYILFTAIPDRSGVSYETILGFSTIVLKEAIAGIVIGLGANICLSIVQFAGRIADMEIGLSMVQLMDPLTRESSGFMGSFYQYALVLIMFLSNFHHFFLRALVDTYTLIPVGKVVFDSDKIVNVMVKFLTDYVVIAFRICLPIVASMLLLNAILGVLAKTAPMINMFSVGIQIKVLVGLIVLFVTIGVLPSASDFVFDEMKAMMQAMTESMSP